MMRGHREVIRPRGTTLTSWSLRAASIMTNRPSHYCLTSKTERRPFLIRMAALTCLFLHVCSAEAGRTCFRSSRPACTLFQHIKQIYQESNMTGYPSKKPEGPAKVEQVNTYRNGTAPRAAEFGK